MASATNSTTSSGVHSQGASTVISDLENEVRSARYICDALVALSENADASRDAISFLAYEAQRYTRGVEAAWEQAFRLSRAH